MQILLKNFLFCILIHAYFKESDEIPQEAEARRSKDIKSRVIGGLESNPHEFAWMISIQRLDDDKFSPTFKEYLEHCGGSLITPDWILTAAQCILPKENEKLLLIVAGAHNRVQNEESQQKRKVEKYITHPEYNKDLNYFLISHDFALIKVDQPFELKDKIVEMVYLPEDSTCEQPFEPCNDTVVLKTMGWGRLNADNLERAEKLRKADYYCVSHEICQKEIETHLGELFNVTKLEDSQFCAKSKDVTKISVCNGDAGSPIMCKDEEGILWQCGVFSLIWGICQRGSKSMQNTPAIFAKTTSVINWIHENTCA